MDAQQSKADYIARRAPEIVAEDATHFEGILPPDIQRKRAEFNAATEWRAGRSYDHTAIVRREGAPERSGWMLEGHSNAAAEGSRHSFGRVDGLPFSWAELLEIRDQISMLEAESIAAEWAAV